MFTVYILGRSAIKQTFQQGLVYWYMIAIILKVNSIYCYWSLKLIRIDTSLSYTVHVL